MRRLLLALGLAVVGMLALVAIASADSGPHASSSATADGCAGCHRAHAASAPRLLKTDQSTLCFSCHDGTGSVLDSWDGASLTAQQTTVRPVGTSAINGALKGGGFVYSRINSGGTGGALPGAALANTTAGVAVTSAHIKGATGSSTPNGLTPMNVIWGNGAVSATANTGKSITASPLTCGDCHNPHGNGQYRILRPIPNQSGAATGVTLADEATKNYLTTNYWNAYRVGATGLPTWTNAQMSAWCSTCHSRYNASSTATSGDAVFKYRHYSDGNLTDTAPSTSPYSTNTYSTSCLQCHVSHGSNAAMGTASQGVPWPGGSTGRGNESALLKIDSRGTCIACHGTTPGN